MTSYFSRFRPASLMVCLSSALLTPALAIGAQTQRLASVSAASEHRLSADGHYLLYTRQDNGFETLWRVTTDEQQTPLQLSPAAVEYADIVHFVISPDGQTVAYVAETGTLQQLYTARLDGTQAPVLLASAAIETTRTPISLEGQTDPAASLPTPETMMDVHKPFGPDYVFSDDSQFLLYVQDSDFGDFNAATEHRSFIRRAFRASVTDPAAVVNISAAIDDTVSSDTLHTYGFVPSSDRVYLSYSRRQNPQPGDRERQLFVVEADASSAPKRRFSATHFHQQFLADGQRVLLVSPDASGVKQLFVYDLTTGNRTQLNTAESHQSAANKLGADYFAQVQLAVYGDWVVYFPQTPVQAFNPKPADVACYITHLAQPERDRKISDRCPAARVLLAEQRLEFDTFTQDPAATRLSGTGPYFLMSQRLDGQQAPVRLAEGHWQNGFQVPDITAFRSLPDGQWASQVHNRWPEPTEWWRLNGSGERLIWESLRYRYQAPALTLDAQTPLFSPNGTRLLVAESTSVPLALQRSYDPLRLPGLTAAAGEPVSHRAMADNCRVFSRLAKAEATEYYMSECDRPWTELWWQPERAGQGLRVQQIGDRAFLTWFTYDTSGAPVWLTLSGQLDKHTLSGELMRFSGPALGTDWDATQVQGTSVGSATMTLDSNADPLAARFAYQMGDAREELALQPFDPGPANQYDGFWWQPQASGQGIQLYHKGNRLFGSAFLYDEAGQSVWVTFQGERVGQVFRGALKRFTGPRLGTPWDNSQVQGETVGEIRLQFVGIDQAAVHNSNPYVIPEVQPDYVVMEYSLNGQQVQLDLKRFRF